MIYTLGTKANFNVGKVIIDRMIEKFIIEQMNKCIEKKRVAAREISLVVDQNLEEGNLKAVESENVIEIKLSEQGKAVERKLNEEGKIYEENKDNAGGDNQTSNNLPANNVTGDILSGDNLPGDNITDDNLLVVNLTGVNLIDDNLTSENLTDAQLIGLFVNDFHQPSLAKEFISSIEALSADRFSSKVTFSLTDNTMFEEAEDLYEELVEYRRSEYLHVEPRLTAGQVVRKKIRSFGKAIRRAFKLKNWRKVFGRRKTATVIANNI